MQHNVFVFILLYGALFAELIEGAEREEENSSLSVAWNLLSLFAKESVNYVSVKWFLKSPRDSSPTVTQQSHRPKASLS